MSRLSGDEEVLSATAAALVGRLGLVTDTAAAVANAAAATAAAPTFTDTAATPPTPNGATTFVDADATTAAETADALYELRATAAALVTDVGAIRTQLNALLGSLRTAGYLDT